MAYLESAAFALAISGRPVGAAQLHLDGALCRDDRALEMTKVVENSSSQPMLTVFAYRPTKIQPSVRQAAGHMRNRNFVINFGIATAVVSADGWTVVVR